LREKIQKPRFQSTIFMGLNISESFFGKGTAGRALKVFFKIKGFLPVIESNCSFYTPGSVF